MKRTSIAGIAAVALLLSQGAFTAPIQDDPKAAALISAWIEALGGLEAYWPLTTARYTLTTELYDSDSGRLRRTRPRYVSLSRTEAGELTRIERWEGDDFIEQGWDGTAEWARLNGAALGSGDKDYDEVRYVSGDVHYWVSLPYKLHDDGVNLHDRGVDDQGRQIVGVSFGDGVGLHDGDSWQYWFVEGRTWPVQVAYMEEGKTYWNYLRFEDIRTVDGYTFVGRRVHFDEQGEITKVLYTHDFELNPALDPGMFTEPR